MNKKANKRAMPNLEVELPSIDSIFYRQVVVPGA